MSPLGRGRLPLLERLRQALHLVLLAAQPIVAQLAFGLPGGVLRLDDNVFVVAHAGHVTSWRRVLEPRTGAR